MATKEIKVGSVVTGTFEVIPQPLKKKMVINLTGFLTANQSELFAKEYFSEKAKSDLKTTTLVVNCTDISPFQQEFLEPLGQFFKDYTSFNKVYIVNPTKVAAKMQLKRVSTQNNLNDKINFVDTLAECL